MHTIFARSMLSRNGKKASDARATFDSFLLHSSFSASVRNAGTSSYLRLNGSKGCDFSFMIFMKRGHRHKTYIDLKYSNGISLPTVPLTKLSTALDISARLTPFLNFIDVTLGCCRNHLKYGNYNNSFGPKFRETKF